MAISGDYSNLLNQMKLNNTAGLLGSSPTIAGIDGDLLNQWAMRGANSAAYRKLLEAQETGTIKKAQNYTELLSDRYFNENYDAKTGKLVKPTYKPDSTSTPAVDVKTGTGDTIDNMRRLALAAINNPGSLTGTHYDMFESMRKAIADNLVTSGKSESPDVVVEDATAAKVTQKTDFHLLTDDQNFTVAGSKGEKNYSFQTGDSLQSVVAAINADSDATGVKAEWSKNDDGTYQINLTSTDTGKASLVRVDQNVGTLFTEAGKSVKGNGTDALTQKSETVVTDADSQAAIAAGVYTGKLFDDQDFSIAGAKGSQTFSFAKGTSVEDVAAAINASTAKTGVTAEVIYNDAGEAEGIGLLAEKAGTGQSVQVTQNKGDLFAGAGKSVKVSGSSTGSNSGGPAINSLSDLGRVTVDNKIYSFADLAAGGAASLTKNPDAALAVLDQALRDIYEGRAQVKGFDPAEYPMASQIQTTPQAAGNTLEIGNYGSNAMTKWLERYVQKTDEA